MRNRDEQDSLIGVMIGNAFFYYEQAMDVRSIAVRSVKKRVESLVTLTFLGVGMGGVVLGGLLMWQNGELEDVMAGILAFSSAKGFVLIGALFVVMLVARGFLDVGVKKLPKSQDGVGDVVHLPQSQLVGKMRNVADYLDDGAQALLDRATVIARGAGHREVMPIHVFVAGLTQQSVQLLFMRLGIQPNMLTDSLKRKMEQTEQGRGVFGDMAKELIAESVKDAGTRGAEDVSAIGLFYSAYKAEPFLQELFYRVDVTEEELGHVVAWIQVNADLVKRYRAYREAAGFKATGTMNSAYTSVATPFLDSVGEDLTVAGAKGALPLLVGREMEMRELLRSSEGGGQSVVLVGPVGVGKDALIAGLAERMVSERVPKVLKDKRLIRLSVPHLLQGGVGSAERLLAVFEEVARSGNIILVIENVHELAEAGGAGVDLATLVATELERGYTFLIATTDPEHYAGVVERSTLGPKLQKITVQEPERFDAIRVLQSKLGAIENTNKVVFTFDAVSALVDLSARYLHEQHLPEKAILLAREVGLSVAKKGETWASVKREDVAQIVSEKSQVPVTQVSREEKVALLDLEKRMSERMVGQRHAVEAVASALRRARAELRSGKRPIANFLFLGPTGVGKTELAKTTAEVYFGSEENMIRFDMSEFQDQASVARIIGGRGEAGLLTEAVRLKPFSLLLLDELEKAHPDILNLFLQVMDDGRLTDGQGRTIDFTNVILIATSNAGTQSIQEGIQRGDDLERIKTQLLEEELKTVYRPEFLNRFDGIMVFTPLTPEDVVAIAYIMLRGVAKQLEVKGIALDVTDKAVHDLAKLGFDPKFGARPLRRAIQEHVEDPIAELLLREDLRRRDKIVVEAPGMVRVEKASEL